MTAQKIEEILKKFKENLDGNLAGDGQCLERQDKYFKEALTAILSEVRREIEGMKYTDYEVCTVGGHTEENCEKNRLSKARFEAHNKVLSDLLQKFGGER